MTLTPAPIRRGPLWILLALLLTATVFRLHNLTAPSLWFDERASVMSAEGHLGDWLNLPLDRVIPAPDFSSTAHQASLLAAWRSPDFHPPLFAITLRCWRDLFGDSDAAARSLSVVVSLAAIVFLFDLGRTLFDTPSASWACAVMAVAQPQIQYAQEARGYALWGALFLAASAAAARLYKYGPGWPRAISLAACSLAMLLTHFLAFASIAAIGIWCAIYLRGRAARQTLVAYASALVVLLIVGAPLVSVAVENHQDAMWLREQVAGHVAATVKRVALLPARFLAEPLKGTEILSSATAVAYVIPFLLFRKSAGMAWCALVLCMGVGAVLTMDLILKAAALSYIRFTLAAAPAVYLVISAVPLRRGLRELIPAAAIAGCLLSLPATYDVSWKGEWRELGGDLRHVASPGDIVVFASPPHLFLADPAKLYEGVAFYANPIRCPILILDRPADAEALRHLHDAHRIWIITTNGGVDLGAELPGYRCSPAGPDRLFCGRLWRAVPATAESPTTKPK